MKKSATPYPFKPGLFLVGVLLCPLVSGQTGFVSIDCGAKESYNDSSGIYWIPDDRYAQPGNKIAVGDNGQPRQLQTLRSFPDMKKKYCYVLAPLQKGAKYLLRASFLYGNYDNINSPPTFDLLFDSNYWDTISFRSKITPKYLDPEIKEIIFMAKSNSTSVCLGRRTNGIPFISALEIRQAPDQNVYDSVNNNYALLNLLRTNFGADKDIRYPDDPFDRIWVQGDPNVPNISTDKNVSTGAVINKPPSIVMRTAQTISANSKSTVYTSVKYGLLYICMYFAELVELNSTSTREFNVYLDTIQLYGSFKPKYLQSANISILKWYGETTYSISFEPTTRSTLDPLLNALEIYRRSDPIKNGTSNLDVKAVTDIKSQFQLQNDSTGDPCLPYNYSWDWLGCSINRLPPRVTSLNLSNREIKGAIPESIAQLSALLSLDLSNNSLTGAIPEFLAELPNLEKLNLENNNLSGPVPTALANGRLSLSLSGNQFLCKPWGRNQCSDNESGSPKGLIIGLVTAAAVALALVCITIIIYRTRAMGKSAGSIAGVGKDFNAQGSREFSYKEVKEITRDFQSQIGQGGFGPVFHGRLLNNGLEVAVKVLSEKSKQGTKEFSTEVAFLSKVYHKNLVSLIGYCSEEGHQILIYEYMSKGNLRKALHESKTCGDFLQSWEARLDIALNAAQGLEYLHTGCKPPIIHRDVKTSNILVDERMEAKISDFGLSRVGPSSEATHVSTDVKGTFGYLDPEYTLTQNLTEKSDVYSFGVVLLEVMSGRPPIDTNDSGEQRHIVPWARLLVIQGNVKGLVDPKIRKDINMASVWKVAELAITCTESRSSERPTMSETVIELKAAIRLGKETDPADCEFGNYASANEMSSLPSPR